MDLAATAVPNGVMPFSGGTLEQPGYVMDAINIYLNAKARSDG